MATSRKPRGTTVERVVDELRERIQRGEFAAGQRLIETDLTTELNVSRGPLREAFGRLAAEGLVTMEPNRGALVRRLTRRDIEELYDVRRVLEGEAAAVAARRIDEGDHRARLEAALEENARFRETVDLTSYLEHNEEFHNLIMRIAGNELLTDLVGRFRRQALGIQLRNLVTAASSKARVSVSDSVDEHEQVAKAILAGDAELAERLMREHVRHTGASLAETQKP
ncbi:DNA-binding GntR family transcriptional regulator [Actinomadura pelletieri DSM 43383]|uniref:DNA-binding GntR family transcriptional regulator n=1 Tax=Actinomadura pelletieri DSM 43383 TaxID=1120940 RepID=A0A495QKP8_9ACTN|nr:GntR family transcriptional regulator [Actinomadura pelletieri]RKS73155.1 DNA-binding GntR family transcriptional regulator [Actinomadura pelletieri DSM 43383]